MRIECTTFVAATFDRDLRAASKKAAHRWARWLIEYHRRTCPRRTGRLADETYLEERPGEILIRPPRGPGRLDRVEAARMFARRGETIFGGQPPGREAELQRLLDEESSRVRVVTRRVS